jgi:hypothetical protein
MSTRFAVSISTLTSSLFLAACGATPVEGAKAGGGSTGTPAGTVATVGVAQDAGPTTTTTLTLGGGNELQGSKLTSQNSQSFDVALDGGTKPHQIDVGRSTKDIQAIVVSRRDEARACYDAALKAHPGIEGNLDIQWTIDPKGAVTDISVDTSHSDIVEPTVGNCVIAIIKKIHFNESALGFETRTHYPFNFHPRSNGVMVVRQDGGT